MKTLNPSVNDILNDYFYYKCSITLKNRQVLVGIFRPNPDRDNKVYEWKFNILPHKEDVYIPHDEILEIEKPDQPND